DAGPGEGGLAPAAAASPAAVEPGAGQSSPSVPAALSFSPNQE
uniref:Progesterone receptor (Fragments) n=1 Tax=Gallus gallus TaxID=9031 RepID=Q7LZ68_CHICK